MRKAKKEGRYMGIAPLGYKNTRDENNKPIVAPDKTAPFVKVAFEEMATGNFTQEEVRQRLNNRGVSCSRNNFNKIIKNPFYIGRLFIPAFKDESEYFTKAMHKPLLKDCLFYKVQDIIRSSKKYGISATRKTCREEFPLRGFLKCCKCGKLLTASTALSRLKRKYYYYHCTQGCKEIYPTKNVHACFEAILNSIVAKKEIMDLYQVILKSFFGQGLEKRLEKIKKLDSEINKNRERINKAIQMMLDGELDSSEYRVVKSNYENANTTLLRIRASLELDKVDYGSKVNGSFNLLKHIDKFYNEARVDVKQKLVGLIFPEKLIFENDRFQTPIMNEIVSLIMLENKELETIKKGTKKNFSLQSPEVSLNDKISNTILQSLDALSALYQLITGKFSF